MARQRTEADFLAKVSDPVNTLKNLDSIVKLLMTESFLKQFVWDQATLDKFPWKDSVQVLPCSFIEFLIEERHRQATIVNQYNESGKTKGHKFNHQLWMRTLRKKFTTSVTEHHSMVFIE